MQLDRRAGPGTLGLLAAGVLILVVAPAGPSAREKGSSAAREPCAAQRREGGWCEEQGVGYLAGVEIASPQLFEALDAHGHPLHAPSLTCGTCRLALEEGGFCAEHRMGFVHGLAYLSPLTYQLARAKLVDPDSITCPTCRAAMQTIGWCDEHGVGMVGERRVIHKADYEMLAEAYRQLLAAVEKSAECETCAAAMVADGYCPEHRIHYSGGRAKAP